MTAIRALGSSGDPAALTLLQALLDGNVQTVDDKEVLIVKDGSATDFGTGKTAVKFNWGKYLAYASNDAPYTSSNPAVTIVSSVTNRGWTDGNGNKIVDCDLNNPAQSSRNGDTCAAATGNFANFGKTGAATIVNHRVDLV